MEGFIGAVELAPAIEGAGKGEAMADAKQLEILEQGVEVWDKWRKENPRAEIDLYQAKLSGADLQGSLGPGLLTWPPCRLPGLPPLSLYH